MGEDAWKTQHTYLISPICDRKCAADLDDATSGREYGTEETSRFWPNGDPSFNLRLLGNFVLGAQHSTSSFRALSSDSPSSIFLSLPLTFFIS